MATTYVYHPATGNYIDLADCQIVVVSDSTGEVLYTAATAMPAYHHDPEDKAGQEVREGFERARREVEEAEQAEMLRREAEQMYEEEMVMRYLRTLDTAGDDEARDELGDTPDEAEERRAIAEEQAEPTCGRWTWGCAPEGTGNGNDQDNTKER